MTERIGLAAGLVLAVVFLCVHFVSDPDDPNVALLDALEERLTGEEGYREHLYLDSLGVQTIGYGFNIEAGMPEPLGRVVLRWEAEQDLTEFRRLWPQFEDQSFAVQVALADMAYQLGPAGAAGFHDMLAAVARGDWQAAIREARDSVWDSQTASRAERVAAVFAAQ